jgi:hypothetical protein
MRRLQRLEWTTRYRPVHIGTLLLGAVSPQSDAEFLYAGQFGGKAGALLAAAGINTSGKSSEAVLSEFQRGGYFLAHVLECPLAQGQGNGIPEDLLMRRIASASARIRRSLKPKRVAIISERLAPVMARLSSAELGCPVVLDGDRPFALDAPVHAAHWCSLREVLDGVAGAR